nr:MAG TPA: hypothetical protein [Caudoviricetes sp.]DAK53564.1 MAG TPA: hypothetical protein [Caudoviricetes sp.]DAK85550.1 MAG TPA: hypothetical protein [Caudoviricetes sp.]DAK88855.1 MAG TPA: hypothetical protein [Caudoviricetes sp.]DAO50178.1 MAG TPA: hypothetical protein [Caudoviricetes sp.]
MSSTVLTHSFFLSKFSYCHSNFPSFPSHSNFATCFINKYMQNDKRTKF